MKRAIALGVLLTGICTTHASAQAGQRLLSSFRTGWTLDCTIAGPTVARLPRADLLRALGQGMEAIRSRHNTGDDGTPPSFRVAGGRPRIEPGGRRMLQRGMLLVDNIWDGGGSGDTADDVVRDAGRFLEAGIVDDDDNESIAVLERAVLTQAFAYAVNSRIAGLCGTTLGAAVRRVAGAPGDTGDGRSLPTSQSGGRGQAVTGRVRSSGGTPRLGGQIARVPRLPVAAGVDLRSRSMGRTLAGIGLMAGGSLLLLDNYRGFCDPRGVLKYEVVLDANSAYVLRPGNEYYGEVGGTCTHDYNANLYFRRTGRFVERRLASEYLADSRLSFMHADVRELRGDARYERIYEYPKLYMGAAMIGAGVLFATVWSDVAATEDVAINITRAGGVRASKSFGW